MRILSTIMVLMLVAVSRAQAQQLDESCTVTLNGQTVRVNPDGSFGIPNVAAADLFGPGGPGTVPDFLGDDVVRVVGTCTSGGQPVYVISDCFRIRQGQTFQVGTLSFSDVPPLSVASITAAPQMPTLTALDQQTPILVTGSFTDGSSGPLDPVLNCAPTFRTSNSKIVSVSPDANNDSRGLATAEGAGTALITVSVEGAAAVTLVTVSLGDPLTNVTGIVQTEDGDPFNGATIRLLVNGMVIAGMGVSGGPGLAPGQFMVNGVASQLGPISVYAEGLVDGQLRSGLGLLKPPVSGGFTDAGLVTLDGRMFWITNADGTWHTGGNWISGTPPTANQTAIIDVPADITVTHQTFPATPIVSLQCAESFSLSGALSLAQPSFVNELFTHGANGTLSGIGTLTVNGPYSWTGGTMDGGGATLLNAGMTISGDATKALFGRTLTNANNGTITWTGSGILSLASQPTINNEPGCTFDVQTDADWNGGLPFGSFNNAGTLRKSAGGGVTSLTGLAMNNSGSVEVEIGTLQVVGGNSSGAFVVDPGATLDFTPHFGPPQNITGSMTVSLGGTLQFTLGTTNLNGPTDITGQIVATAGFNNNGVGIFNATASTGVAASSLSIINGGTLSFAGPAGAGSALHASGSLSGPGTLTVNGPYTWTGGTMGVVGGGGTTLLNAGMIISGDVTKALFGRTLTNANNGTITWTGGGNLSLASQPTINNEAGCTFDVRTDADWTGGLPFGAFNNAGTLRKSAGGGVTTLAGLAMNNSGSVEVEIGTLQVQGGNSSGAFVVDPGAAIDFSGGFGPPQTITGSLTVPAGATLQFSSGTTNVNGPTDVDGQIVVTGGFNTNGVGIFNATASKGVAASSLSIINGGTLSFAGPAGADSVSHAAGTLSGAGALTVNGAYTWTEGTMTGGGTTLLNGGMTMSGTAAKNLFGRTLTNANNGTITWTGSGNLNLGFQPTINNEPGCTFDVQTDADSFGGSPFGTFNNSGTLRKSAGSAVTTLGGFSLNNSGIVEVTSGTLDFNVTGGATYTQSAGGTVLAGGSIARSGFGSPMQINGGTIGLGPDTASGTITGNVALGSAGTVVPRPGGAGRLTVIGNYTQNAGTLAVELGGLTQDTEYDRLAVTGNATLGGTLDLTLIDGFVPGVGDSFQILTATGTLSGTFTNVVATNLPRGLGASVSYGAGAATVMILSD